jgi:hypothetical protein
MSKKKKYFSLFHETLIKNNFLNILDFFLKKNIRIISLIS